MKTILRLIVGLFLVFSVGKSKAQFVDTLNITIKKDFTIYHVANFNCKEKKCFDEGTCWACFDPANEVDSVLQNVHRIHDSIYIKVHDPKGVLRMEYLRPHAQSIWGDVKIYNKKGELIRVEHYSDGSYHDARNGDHHPVAGYLPFRTGDWKYYEDEQLVKMVRYQLVHSNDQTNYYGLVKEFIYFPNSKMVSVQNEYLVHLADLEFDSKPNLKHPIFTTRGKQPNERK